MSNTVIPFLLDSLASAALIFFAAVGLTLVFSVLRVLNVAHGSLYSIGAYVAASVCLFIASRQLNPYLSFAAL
ncbi:MAG: branched-chain amino acid ABC transporter permease, partial [Xanthobacteraceae bacterium]|nr:branched-chain amino acid ABC transporter permease [Xanthobacteraceae bacterium]